MRGGPSPGPLGAPGARTARRACHLTRPTRGYRPVPPTLALRCSTDMKLDASWYSDKDGEASSCTTPGPTLLERHVFVTWVAGISHYPAAVDLPDFEPGSEVVLRPEPDNPFDPNAIGVWNASGSVQVGYLPAVIVRDLPSVPEGRHGLMVGEMVHGRDRVRLWVVVAREPVVPAWSRTSTTRRSHPSLLGCDTRRLPSAGLRRGRPCTPSTRSRRCSRWPPASRRAHSSARRRAPRARAVHRPPRHGSPRRTASRPFDVRQPRRRIRSIGVSPTTNPYR